MVDEPKSRIIIDEDWKTQVAREKEELERKQHPEPPAEPASSAEPLPAAARGPLPEASFEMLVTALASEAMLYLGQIPHPSTGQPVLDLEQARHVIDVLGVLEEKTRGNLTPDEAQLMQGVLHDLRMGYLAIQQSVAQAKA